MTAIEHWFCPGCGEVDGPRAGMTCHGPGNTGGCATVRNEVVEISHDAAERLQGAVGDERERIANMLANAAENDERGGFDERTRTVLRSFARTIATGRQPAGAGALPRTDAPNTTEET